jgi:GNAT superfamily N-acetyltransferase
VGSSGRIEIVVESPSAEVSLALQQAFFADIATRYPGWHPGSSQSVSAEELAPPRGTWLVVYLDGRPVGCGGVQAVEEGVGEVRRLFLDRSARGTGIGRALLRSLEDRARQLGYARVRLTTGDEQPEALALFVSSGYEEIAPFTDGAFTRHWLEKPLPPPSQ